MENNDKTIGGSLPRLRSVYNSLTKVEQKIADYILANPAEVIHKTITELAEASDSAEATIFRLCQKTGFRGFQHFKIALASDLYTPMESVYNEVAADDEPSVIAQKVFAGIAESLQDTLHLINSTSIERAVDALSAARRIDVYGSAGSAIVAADIEHRFLRFGIPIHAFADPHMQISSAALLEPGDIVIAVSHNGSNRDLLESVDMAKESGATVIAITSHMKSPLSGKADICLYGTAREVKYRSEAMAARLMHLAIADVLYVNLLLRHPDRTIANIQKIRKAIAVKRL
jgi:RpiR family carbohydrate utilization transcriptional regulator